MRQTPLLLILLRYGWSVAVSGNTIAVGAWEAWGVGAVYVFLKPPTGWSTVNETAKLTASDGVENDSFGVSVAIGGNAVAAGATSALTGAIYTGAIYLFVRPATGWRNMTQTFKRIPPGVRQRDTLGSSVAFGGNTIVVAGAPNSSNSTGAAYIFERMP